MTKTNRLIPQNKFDTSTIKQLERIKTEQISTISMQLLEWIADMNWPVAQELIKDTLIPITMPSEDIKLK